MDFTTTKGDTFQGFTCTLLQSSIPVDISGATFKMQVRKNMCSDIVLEWSTVDNSITISDGPNGIFAFDSVEIDLTPATYKFDCKMTLLSTTNTIFTGAWVVTESITH